MGVPRYICGMYTRRKPNKTGSISVQVILKNRGRNKVVKSFGTGRCESELIELESKARRYILQKQGLTNTLFPDPLEKYVEDFVSTLSNSNIQVAGPELVFGSLYDKIGYKSINNELFRHLVITRIFNPGSKLKTIDYLYRYQGQAYSTDQIYRFLDNLCYRKEKEKEEKEKKKKPDMKTRVEEIAYSHTCKVLGGTPAIVFYDMTTLFFESSDEDDLRKTGFSKDGKHQCPQIFLGLLVSLGGNPIGYDIFEGNIFEGHTLIPVLKKMQSKFNLDKPIVVADSGLLSSENIRLLEEDKYEYILGARPKNESEEIKKKILSFSMIDGQVRLIRKDKKTRLVLSMSDKRAKKDAYNRSKGLERLKKRIGSGKLTKSSINNRGYNKYLRMEGDVELSIDMEKYNQDAFWDGIKGYVTNTRLSGKSVIDNYNNLWFIERAFRINKTDLRIRPIYHQLRNRIEGHICICFTAYTILLELERMLKKAKSAITINRAQELVRNMYCLSYILPETNKYETKVLKMDQEQDELYQLVLNWMKK